MQRPDGERGLPDPEDSLISGTPGGTGGDLPMGRLLMVVYVPLDGFDPPDLLPLDPELAYTLAHGFVDDLNEMRAANDGPFSDLEVCGLPAPQWLSVRTMRRILAADDEQMRADIAAVLTVYDEHVAPENRGPWRDRLAALFGSSTQEGK